MSNKSIKETESFIHADKAREISLVVNGEYSKLIQEVNFEITSAAGNGKFTCHLLGVRFELINRLVDDLNIEGFLTSLTATPGEIIVYWELTQPCKIVIN